MLRALSLALALALQLGGCALPDFMAPYRIDIQQGNNVTQEMVSQLKPGMSKEQVRYLLGTPLVADIFHAERWDYVYDLDRKGRPRERARVTVHFEDGKLAQVSSSQWWIPAR